jgi:hypothetical protein
MNVEDESINILDDDREIRYANDESDTHDNRSGAKGSTQSY